MPALQEVDCEPDPAHWLPPWAGAGLLHDLDLVQVPVSQVTEHPAQEPQDPQLPWTAQETPVLQDLD